MSFAITDEMRIESARYALLRRLAFAMRHHVARHLQPIGMITDVVERRLKSDAPDLAQIHDNLSRANTHARAAVQSSLDVVSWLAPEEGARIALDEGVHECVEMLRSHFAFRGFALRDDALDPSRQVSRCALRSVLPAALFALADHAKGPAEIAIDTQAAPNETTVSLRLAATQGPLVPDTPLHYRVVEWDDVAALARAEGVQLAHSPSEVRITLAA
jgi:C4-dicarboxylate-specific signal transduction histidine kinase